MNINIGRYESGTDIKYPECSYGMGRVERKRELPDLENRIMVDVKTAQPKYPELYRFELLRQEATLEELLRGLIIWDKNYYWFTARISPLLFRDGDEIEIVEYALKVTKNMALSDETTFAAKIFKSAMQKDPDFAKTWHDNLAMAFFAVCDRVGPDSTEHKEQLATVNKAATNFMDSFFNVKTEGGVK